MPDKSKKSKFPSPITIYCPYCNKPNNLIRAGKRNTSRGLKQLYYCKKCSKYFTDTKLKHQQYPPETILDTISTYNLGHTIEKTNRIINRRYKMRIPQSTIHSWLRRYQDVCSFANLRRKYNIDPDTIIQSKRLHHIQIYNFKYHQLKLNLAAKKFPRLRQYIMEVFDHCPQELFRAEGPRCSSLRIDVKPRRVMKYNNAPKLAEFALLLAKTNKERHEKVQDFMLVNDSATIAIELPVFLHPNELTKNEQKHYAIELSDTLTGHIDLLQVRFNQIHVLDYKPDAKKTERRAAEQVFLYTLALSKRTNIPLENFTCAYFDERNYYQFKPIAD